MGSTTGLQSVAEVVQEYKDLGKDFRSVKTGHWKSLNFITGFKHFGASLPTAAWAVTILRDPLDENKDTFLGAYQNAIIRLILPARKNWRRLFPFSLYMVLFTSGSYNLSTGQWSVGGFIMEPGENVLVSWGDLFDLQSAVSGAAIGDYDDAFYFKDIAVP